MGEMQQLSILAFHSTCISISKQYEAKWGSSCFENLCCPFCLKLNFLASKAGRCCIIKSCSWRQRHLIVVAACVGLCVTLGELIDYDKETGGWWEWI